MCAQHFILTVTVLLLLSGCVCDFFPVCVCVCACSYVYFNVACRPTISV